LGILRRYTLCTLERSAAPRSNAVPENRRTSRFIQSSFIPFMISNARQTKKDELMYKGRSITVIIPCLNEEQGIEQILRAMPEFVDEVVVVDNNSTDRTSAVAASLGAKVVREEVRGYGRAYKRGFAGATSDLIITL